MSGNILSTVMQFFTPELAAKLASAVGVPPTMVPKVVGAAVPAILSSLAGIGAEPGGPRKLADAISTTPPGMLNNFASKLGDESSGLLDQGKDLLASLLGGGGVGALTSAIAKATGIGEGTVRTLLGYIAPAVVGLLGKAQRTGNLDETGLARALRSQAEDFTDAMPSNVSGLLDSSGFFDRAVAPPAAAKYMKDEPMRSSRQSIAAASAANRDAGKHSWLYWALPLLAIAGFGLYFLNSSDMTREVAVSPQSNPARAGMTGGGPVYLTGSGDNGAPLSAYLRRPVDNAKGERLGTINEVLVLPDGRVGTLVLGVERALGLGEKDVAIPFSGLLISRRDDGWQFVLDASKETLQNAPRFTINEAGALTKMPKQ